MTQLFLLAVLAQNGGLLLTEYNAVGSQKWLDNDGVAACEGPGGSGCSDGSDKFFARRMGNGGDWVEFVVTEDHVDLRGWTVQWAELGEDDADGTDVWYGNGGVPQGQFTFADAEVWSDLRIGTILTITDQGTDTGGLDTDLSYDPCSGDYWINANIYDSELFVAESNIATPVPDLLDVGNDDWMAQILDASGAVTAGLVGEGAPGYGGGGVNSREACRLEESPTNSSGIFSLYDDTDNSTFSVVNNWSDLFGCRVYADLEVLQAGLREEYGCACTPLALNEYNAVDEDAWLGGGDASGVDDDGDGVVDRVPSDTNFGRTLGNGGDWMEFVVLQDGVDLRGWTLHWSQDAPGEITYDAFGQPVARPRQSGVITFGDAAELVDLDAGTLLTLTEWTTAEGGLDTTLTADWINLNTFDTSVIFGTTRFLDGVEVPGHISGEWSVSNREFMVEIRDCFDAVVFTASGEGSDRYAQGAVGSNDVCRLREDPSQNTTRSSAYDDADTSTFGGPNIWDTCGDGVFLTQDLSGIVPGDCENSTKSCESGNPLDLDGDGMVGFSDVLMVLANWGCAGSCPEDVDFDGTVGFSDVLLLLASWG